MTREELRQKQIANDDQLRNGFGGLVWRHMDSVQQSFVICGRDLLANPTPQEDAIVNAFLDVFVARINHYNQHGENHGADTDHPHQ